MKHFHIETLRATVSSSASWVLFEGGTAVFLPAANAQTDLASAAQELLREHGPVHVGSPSGDFNPFELESGRGWAVSFDHPDILALVAPDEIEDNADSFAIGFLGRCARSADAETLEVAHVEDKRASPP